MEVIIPMIKSKNLPFESSQFNTVKFFSSYQNNSSFYGQHFHIALQSPRTTNLRNYFLSLLYVLWCNVSFKKTISFSTKRTNAGTLSGYYYFRYGIATEMISGALFIVFSPSAQFSSSDTGSVTHAWILDPSGTNSLGNENTPALT